MLTGKPHFLMGYGVGTHSPPGMLVEEYTGDQRMQMNYIEKFKSFMSEYNLTTEQERQIIQLVMNKHYRKCRKCNWCKRNNKQGEIE